MTLHRFRLGCALLLGFFSSGISFAMADGPADNQVDSVRPVPPPGIAIDAGARSELEQQLAKLSARLVELRSSKKEMVQRYLPDVEIFERAVAIALQEDGFYEPVDVERAKELLQEGMKRADALDAEKPDWLLRKGLVVRGFRSKLDGSVQPYGVVFHAESLQNRDKEIRTDVWCRGRSEKGLELQFLHARMHNPDPAPTDSRVMVVHPFGRYCNANKLAGEVDTLEAIEHALTEYQVNRNMVSIRGFSMGGAAAWHLAVHYPDKWFAANPGAGFSETPQFLKVFQSESLKPEWYEEKLWQWYDCPVWVRNLRMLPTIAYSGEVDKQKQAADVMVEAAWNLPEAERFELTHIVAPKTAHQVAPEARAVIERRLNEIASSVRLASPNVMTFTTTTLKYNQMYWVKILGLEEHWKPATVHAAQSEYEGRSFIRIRVSNISELELEPTTFHKYAKVSDDPYYAYSVSLYDSGSSDAALSLRVPFRSDRSWKLHLRKVEGRWEQVSPVESRSTELVKKHNLQGPIDDAFMGPFLFVKPSTSGQHAAIDKWVDSEFAHAVREWHRQMRGDAPVKTSEELQPDDINNRNLILWGDPKSNPTLAKILERLPIQWTNENVIVSAKKYDASTHAPILIFPNPLNPERYVVLNSGFTYREYDYLNNARQVPKLPDWAIIDTSTPPNARWPGKVADANFFDERWKLK